MVPCDLNFVAQTVNKYFKIYYYIFIFMFFMFSKLFYQYILTNPQGSILIRRYPLSSKKLNTY